MGRWGDPSPWISEPQRRQATLAVVLDRATAGVAGLEQHGFRQADLFSHLRAGQLQRQPPLPSVRRLAAQLRRWDPAGSRHLR